MEEEVRGEDRLGVKAGKRQEMNGGREKNEEQLKGLSGEEGGGWG